MSIFKSKTEEKLIEVIQEQQATIERLHQAMMDMTDKPVNFTKEDENVIIEPTEEFIEEVSDEHIGELINSK